LTITSDEGSGSALDEGAVNTRVSSIQYRNSNQEGENDIIYAPQHDSSEVDL